MGASLVASIIEHLDVINLPVRKRGLNDYVMLNRNFIEDDFFKKRTIEILNNYSKKVQLSGLGVRERDKSKKKKFFDFKKNKKIIYKFKKKKFSSLSEMYFESMYLLNNCTSYKNKVIKPKGSIEFVLGINFYDTKKLYSNYKKNFRNVKIINLNRNFSDWFEALVSQNFSKNISLKYLKMSIINNYLFYKKYNKKIKNFNALNVKFESIFKKKKYTFNKIINYLSPKKKIDFDTLMDKKFDVFGSICGFEKAFKISDKKYSYLNKITMKFVNFTIFVYERNKVFGKCLDLIFQFLYIYNLFIYKVNNK